MAQNPKRQRERKRSALLQAVVTAARRVNARVRGNRKVQYSAPQERYAYSAKRSARVSGGMLAGTAVLLLRGSRKEGAVRGQCEPRL